MGKSINESEYGKAKQQLKACRTTTCPNAGAREDAETSEYCGACKGARRTVKDYERVHR